MHAADCKILSETPEGDFRQRRAQSGGQTGGSQYAGGIHARGGKVDGIQENDIGHGHEGGQSCPDFRGDCGAVLIEVKQFFHKMPFLL